MGKKMKHVKVQVPAGGKSLLLIVSFGVTQKVQLILLVTETHGWGEIVISNNLLALFLFFP